MRRTPPTGVRRKGLVVGIVSEMTEAPGEETLEITPHFGVGILLNEQRRGRVLEVKRQQARLETSLAHPAGNPGGQFVKTAAAGLDGEFMDSLL